MSDDLRDLAERLSEANANLLLMAQSELDRSVSTDFLGNKFSVNADRLTAKAEGVRLALSYVHEAMRA